MEFKGKIKNILPLQKGTSAKGEWQKIEFVVETQEQYPRSVLVSAMKPEIIAIVQDCKIGDDVTLQINPKVNEYQNKFYNSLTVWSLKVENKTTVTKKERKEVDLEELGNYTQSEDNLPF